MSQLKDKPSQKPRRTEPRDQFDDGSSEMAGWARTLRETVESVVIAFVLAFLFRTFEAEAFVIPTGSMAPTLKGRHLDVDCPMCGYHFQVGARSEDIEEADASARVSDIPFCICPNCRYRLELTDPAKRKQFPTQNGDRILVSKFSFDFTPPLRWNVIVFKFPEDAKTNYIKRLIGLPGEVIRIRDGDISASSDGGKTFPPELVHRDFPKLRAMMQTVYDDDYEYEPFVERGWPARWQSAAEAGGAVWTNSMQPPPKQPDPVYDTTGKSADGHSPPDAWLRYYNYAPSLEDWTAYFAAVKRGKGVAANWDRPTPRPITDFSAYDVEANGHVTDMLQHDRPAVDDLAVECQADVRSAEGKIVLELVKRRQKFQCVLDLAAGTAELVIPWQKPDQRPRAAAGGISRAGSYRLFFANVDHELMLAINGREVHFDRPTSYDFPPEDETPAAMADAANFTGSPVGICSSGAAMQVAHLRVLRDIYYTYEAGNPADFGVRPQYNQQLAPASWPRDNEWVCVPPKAAATLMANGAEVRPRDQFYFIGENQFFPLGDNSPLSADGRLWNTTHFVDRRLLIGKALFIYWPHGLDKIPHTQIPFPYGMFPNFHSMGFVR